MLWGPHLSDASPNGWGVQDGSQTPLILSEMLQPMRSLSIVCHYARGGMGFPARPNLSLLPISWCGPFIPCCRGNCSASFWFFLSRNYFICGCRSGMSVGGGEFRIFLCYHLGPPPPPPPGKFIWFYYHCCSMESSVMMELLCICTVPILQPLATCGCLALDMLLIQLKTF